MKEKTVERAERARVWRMETVDGVELLRATYITHNFPRHAHDGFAVGVIEQGALGFYYRGENVVAPAGCINLANPDEVHTGHAAVEDGWTYRMFYIDVERLREAASQIAGRSRSLPFFRSGVLADDGLACSVRSFHLALENCEATALERHSRFLEMLAQLILRHADNRPVPHRAGNERKPVRRVRDFIEDHFDEDVSLEQLAEVANLSPFHLIRVFRDAVGLPPHAFLTQIRVRRARSLLALGEPIARVAAETGFVDQSHLTRHFKRIMGVTPGQYSKIVQDR